MAVYNNAFSSIYASGMNTISQRNFNQTSLYMNSLSAILRAQLLLTATWSAEASSGHV